MTGGLARTFLCRIYFALLRLDPAFSTESSGLTRKLQLDCGIRHKIASYLLPKFYLTGQLACAENFVRNYFALFRLGSRNQLQLPGY